MARIAALAFAFFLSAAIARAADAPVDGPGIAFRDDLIAHLEGHWDVTRAIRGREARNTLEAQWVLEHQFLQIHLKDVAVPAKYEAYVYVGWSHAEQRYVIDWMDVYGGHYSLRGHGARRGDSIEFRFVDDAGKTTFANTFMYDRAADAWTMSLENVAADGTRTPFARDRLARRLLAPLADHHQHLQSPATAALANRTDPEIAVPRALATLLRERERAWNDAAALQRIFTRDAQIFTGGNPGWADAVKGTRFLGSRFSRAYRLTPTTLRVNGARAGIGGYYTRGEGADTSRIGYFHLALDRDARGAWRIASEVPVFPGPPIAKVEDARDLLKYLDEAGIRRAVVLSDAYYFDSPKNDVADRHAKVRLENDWTAAQVAPFGERLVAFCSFNPLADWAIEELERCADGGRFTGIKLHFGMSAVDLRNPAHVEKVRAVVAAANRRRMPLIVHARTDPKNYGAEDARILLTRIVSAAPDVTFQIAHLWGGEAFSGDALQVFADAVASGDPVTRNLYFDIAEAALVVGDRPELAEAAVRRMREIGLDRILYATDGPVEESQTPADGWKATRKLPLEPEELDRIARNVAPYLATAPKPLK